MIKKNYVHLRHKTVDVVQSVRTSDCGSEGRRFESGLPPHHSDLEGQLSTEMMVAFLYLPHLPYYHPDMPSAVFAPRIDQEKQHRFLP